MNFSKHPRILKKLKEFSKNSRISIKLRVLEAMCLMLPPKNRAKKGPELNAPLPQRTTIIKLKSKKIILQILILNKTSKLNK